MFALDVFLLFVRDSRILLALRENTGYSDGRWNVPSGKAEPVNAEPHKCGGLQWAAVDALPDNTVPYTTAGVTQYRKGITYGHLAW